MNLRSAVLMAVFSLSVFSGVSFGASKAHGDYHSELFKLMPGAAKVKALDAHSYEILDKSGKLMGKVLLDATKKEDKQIGFAGPIEVMVAVDAQDKVLGVLLGENDETPGFIKRVKTSGFMNKWNGLSLKDAAALDVETVSGATRSSTAIKSGVQSILNRVTGKASAKVAAHSVADVKGLHKQYQFLTKGIAYCEALEEQWKTRLDEEVAVRFIYAVEGAEAGAKAAKAKNLKIFKRGKANDPKLQALVKAYKAEANDANKKALTDFIEKDLADLKVAINDHKVELAKSLKAVKAEMMKNAPKAKKPAGMMQFRSPEAKKLEARIQALAGAYRKAPNAAHEKALKAALKEQLELGLTGMGKFVEKKEQELKALKATYDGIKAKPQEAIDKRFKELTTKRHCGKCKKHANKH